MPVPNDPWSWIWQLGYRCIVPITPGQKSPGVLTPDGWIGFRGWQTSHPSESDVDRYREWGAGVGIRCEDGLLAIDVDTMDERLSVEIETEITARLGVLPQRIGRAPKKLYLLRTSSDYAHAKIKFDGGEIDIRTYGQFVASGIHPDTGMAYQWVRPLLPRKDLPHFDPATLEGVWFALKAILPNVRLASLPTLVRDPVDPATLRGTGGRVRRALEFIPNDYDRDTYINVLTAVKGALPDDLEDGWDLVWPWCESWRGPNGEENDRDVVRRDFDSLKPIALGIGYLEMLADKRSGGVAIAERNHEPIIPPPPPLHFSEPATCFDGLPIPSQAWLAPDLIPARNVTLFYGDGGTGKSLSALQLAFSVATGVPWLGVPVTRGRALFISAEDERDEIHRRLAAIAAGSGYGLDELGDLYVRSLSGQNALLAEPDIKTTLLKTTALYATIRTEILRLRPALIVLDTLADMFGGDEVKRVHARQFIQFLQSYVVDVDFELSVVLLGQPSVSGMNSGSGTSGSTAWSNSVRSRLYLERRYVERAEKRIETDTDIRVLTTKKANRTKLGGEIVMRWANGRFVVDAASSAVQETADDAADETVFLALLAQFTKTGRNVSHNVAAPSYAPKQFLTTKAGSDLGKARLASAMARLFERHEIKVEIYGAPSKGYNRIIGVSREGL